MSAAEQIAIAKAEMEHSIMMSVGLAVAEFKARTGATPESVQVEMVVCRTIGEPDEHVVSRVIARIEL